MSSLAGDHEGFGVRLDDVKQKQELAQRLRKNKKLVQLARKLGGLKQSWTKRLRAKTNALVTATSLERRCLTT